MLSHRVRAPGTAGSPGPTCIPSLRTIARATRRARCARCRPRLRQGWWTRSSRLSTLDSSLSWLVHSSGRSQDHSVSTHWLVPRRPSRSAAVGRAGRGSAACTRVAHNVAAGQRGPMHSSSWLKLEGWLAEKPISGRAGPACASAPHEHPQAACLHQRSARAAPSLRSGRAAAAADANSAGQTM